LLGAYAMMDFAELLNGLDAAKLQRLARASDGKRSEELNQLRRLAWAQLLHVVKGNDVAAWVEELKVQRRQYRELVEQHQQELDVKKFDASIANPLSRNAANPFLKKQANDELLQEIEKDIERTYPEVPLLQDERSRRAMQQVLFHWCKANNPAKDASESYRQGMNELVAVLYFAVRSGEFAGASSPAADLCGSAHSEADTFALFSSLMEAGLREMFAVEKGKKTPAKSPIGELPVPRSLGPPERGRPQSAILARCAFIFDVLLKALDEPLHRRIQQHGIEPQIFLLRWLRLLFCREFHLEDTLVIWDAIFADSFESPGLGSLKYAKGGGNVAERAEAASMALPLVDYTAVAMLMFVRQDLMTSDESDCLQRLLKFPPVESVRSFTELAARLRSGAAPPREGFGGGSSAAESASGPSGAASSPGDGSSASAPSSSAATGGYPAQPQAAAPASGRAPAAPVPANPLGRAAVAATAPGGGGGLLDAATSLFDVGKQALIDAKQRVSQLAAGDGGGVPPGTRPGARPSPPTAERQAEVRRSLFDQESEASASQLQLAELQKRVAVAEQERDSIKKKASEFVQAKKAEFGAKVAELEAKLAASEARVKEFEARQAAGAEGQGPARQPSDLAAEAEADGLRRRVAELEERLAAAEASAAEVPSLQQRLKRAEDRCAAAEAEVKQCRAVRDDVGQTCGSAAAGIQAAPAVDGPAETPAAVTAVPAETLAGESLEPALPQPAEAPADALPAEAPPIKASMAAAPPLEEASPQT